jgi:hypothetical protein
MASGTGTSNDQGVSSAMRRAMTTSRVFRGRLPGAAGPASLCLLFAGLLSCGVALAKPAAVAYSSIDVAASNAAVELLNAGTPGKTAALVAAIEADPSLYTPEVLYALSNRLFDDGRKDDGAFWFYAGQLRARFDANRCAEVDARQVVSALTYNYGTKINQYTFQDPEELAALIRRVVEWDRTMPHRYDPRWINWKWNEYMTVLYHRGKRSSRCPRTSGIASTRRRGSTICSPVSKESSSTSGSVRPRRRASRPRPESGR